MTETNHKLYNVTETAKALGRSSTYIVAVKKAMGQAERRLFDEAGIAAMKQWIQEHPEFRVAHAFRKPKRNNSKRK